MNDKWASYREKFCGCKDASRKNSCKGLSNCSLRPTDPERQMQSQDLARFWNGRPKGERIHYTRYFFVLGNCRQFVDLQPSRYRPVDWRGLL